MDRRGIIFLLPIPMRSRAHSDQGGSEQSRQTDVNRTVYESPRVYRRYLGQGLTPSETACLLKYQSEISGRDVLDIGVGAGRTTYYLAPLASRYEAVDYSSVMVRYMKEAMPHVSVQQADFRDLSVFGDHSFHFVFAPNNVIDALSHEGRLQALRESARVLRPHGLLSFSSHNLNYKKAYSRPHLNWSSNPMRLAYRCFEYALSWTNYLRLSSLRRTTPEYALLNDRGHYYACLHYYAARSIVTSQLARVGLKVIAVFDTLGRVLPDCSDDSDNPSLLYVAERTSG